MTERPPAQTTAADAYNDLLAKQRLLAQQLASLRAQLRAVEQAKKELEPHDRGDLVRLVFTTDDAILLVAACYKCADRTPELGREIRDLINRLGDEVVKAAYDQDAEFAAQLRKRFGKPSSQANRPPAAAKIPKKDCPYLRYSVQQMDAAIARTSLGSRYNFVTRGYVRLYLSRAALLEMYRRPRHVRVVYAHLLKEIDSYQGSACDGVLREDGRLADHTGPPRSRPYEQHSEGEMLAALKRLGLSPWQVKVSYGLLTLSLFRPTVLCLYRMPARNPAVAYLIKRLDEFRQQA